jgi:hypothetical protein
VAGHGAVGHQALHLGRGACWQGGEHGWPTAILEDLQGLRHGCRSPQQASAGRGL